ncbi:hypothetical protein [Bdellovibrio bacteriovorus]|uniref:hypothetical protein n=1 Tax=Bdellovibrio bacteriovorus TaxID=959 RepID=UPI0035A5FEB3
MKTIVLFFLFFLPSLLFAQAQVYPTHLTLTEESPSSYLNLKNPTSETQTYKIELTYFKMKKDGSMRPDPSTSTTLTDILKFSPKSISLTPNEKQVIRVMVTSFDNLEDGESYVHLRFLPTQMKSGEEKNKTNGSSFSLTARIAVAVPIIVRKGAGTIAGEIKNLKATYDKQRNLTVNLSLKNTSKYFLHGDLDLFAITNKGEVSLDKVIGLSSYLPERSYAKRISSEELAKKLNDERITKIKVSFKSNAESASTFDLSQETEVQATSTTSKNKRKSNK